MMALASAVAMPSLGCRTAAFCGDGSIDPGEACDDGNSIDGDGCSASCELDDNLGTPGDDRAGYVTCTGTNAGASVTCGPGLGCCNDPDGTTCAASGSDCVSPFDFQGCDGDEDCPQAGTQCWVYRTTDCWSQSGYELRCHTDSDCIAPEDSCDASGQCPLYMGQFPIQRFERRSKASPSLESNERCRRRGPPKACTRVFPKFRLVLRIVSCRATAA